GSVVAARAGGGPAPGRRACARAGRVVLAGCRAARARSLRVVAVSDRAAGAGPALAGVALLAAARPAVAAGPAARGGAVGAVVPGWRRRHDGARGGEVDRRPRREAGVVLEQAQLHPGRRGRRGAVPG